MRHGSGTTTVVDGALPAVAPIAPAWPTRRRVGRVDPWLIATVSLGAIARMAWLAYARPVPVSDFRHYLRLGLTLLDTGSFGVGHPSAWRLPAYPAVLAVGAMIDRDPLALAALTVLISVAQVAVTWWVASRIFASRPAAAAAAAAAALAPASVMFAPVLASEHLLAVCVLAAFGVAIGPSDPSPAGPSGRAALVAGILLGVGVLTRGEAVAYLPTVALLAGWRRWRRDGRVVRAIGAAAVTLLGAVLVVAPWIVRNERTVGPGAGLTTTGGFNFYLAHSPGGYGWRTPLPLPLQVTDEVTRNTLGWRYGLQHVRRHPDDWWPTARRGTRELLAPSTYAAHYATVVRDPATGQVAARDDLGLRDAAIALAGRSSQWLLWSGAAGLALMPVWRRPGWLAVVGIVVANWALYAVIFWAQARYRFVVDAFACVAVGAVPLLVPRVRAARRGGRRS